MKKKRFFRISKRIFILILCCTLVSGACVNKYKVTANAASLAASLGAYSLYEICLYIGGTLLVSCGLGALIDNRDQIASLGKDFIDSMDFENVSDWLLSKVNTTGQSYVFGSEAFKEVQTTSWEVIQGGGNMPENNDDNDGDGDVDADDRTEELKNLGLWATSSFIDMLCEYIEPLIQEAQAGEENFLTSAFSFNEEYFDGIDMDVNGKYIFRGYVDTSTSSDFSPYYINTIHDYLPVVYINRNSICFTDNRASNQAAALYFDVTRVEWGTTKEYRCVSLSPVLSYAFNVPVFGSKEDALNYINTGDSSGILNGMSKVYTIADWLQEDWRSVLEQLNTGIRSLYDNMLIVGEAMNQALINQLNGLGYISAVGEGIAGAVPLPLPGVIQDPEYYPDDSPVAPLDPGDYPWVDPEPVPDPDPVPDPTPDPGEDVVIGDYAIDLRKLFPFCIPFDFIALLRVLDAEPEAPRFEVPFVVPSVGIDETYVIDLSMFNDVMEIIRLFELVGFVIGLMLLTGKVIKW